MSTEQKENQLKKVLRDLSNQRPVTALSLKAAIVLEAWDEHEVPREVQTLIVTMFSDDR